MAKITLPDGSIFEGTVAECREYTAGAATTTEKADPKPASDKVAADTNNDDATGEPVRSLTLNQISRKAFTDTLTLFNANVVLVERAKTKTLKNGKTVTFDALVATLNGVGDEINGSWESLAARGLVANAARCKAYFENRKKALALDNNAPLEPLTGTNESRAVKPVVTNKYVPAEVRAWAILDGRWPDLKANGRIPADVLSEYRKAHS